MAEAACGGSIGRFTPAVKAAPWHEGQDDIVRMCAFVLERTMPPRVGSEFAGYRIDALLGRGGMSVVYRAENPRLGNKVALKVLAQHLADDDVFRERFVRESRTAASLNHPNVIPIYDAGESEGLLFIAMRFVEGSDLSGLLQREGPLGIERAVAIFSQIASALDTAHERNLIHRDIKPANILLESAFGSTVADHVYVSDFGVAKHRASRSGLTQTHQYVGTLQYISPEQLEGREIDGRADLYSLGCLFYECLTGMSPFDRESEYAVMLAHLREPPPRLSAMRPDLPTRLDDVIGRALAKSPDDRYPTAREFIDDVVGSRPKVAATAVAASPSPGTVQATNPLVGNVPAPPLQRPGGLQTPTTGGGSEPPSWFDSTPPEAAGQTPPSGGGARARWPLSTLAAVLLLILLAAGGAAAATYFLTRDNRPAAAKNANPSGSNSTKMTTTGGSMHESTTPGSAMAMGSATLAQLLDTPIRKYCKSAMADGGASGVDSCVFPPSVGGAEKAQFTKFPTAAATSRAYEKERALAHLVRDKGACNGISWGGEEEWLHGPGEVGGRRFCYFKNGSSFIVWTVDEARLLATASRSDLDHPQLFNWWRFWHHRVGTT